MLEPGRREVEYRAGRVQRNAGLVRGEVGNLIHLHKSRCYGGAVVEMKEILVRHGDAIAIVYGDR